MTKLSLNSFFAYGSSFLLCATLSSTVSAQCASWEAFPEGVSKAEVQHVLYRDLLRANKFTEAFPLWEKLFQYVKSPKEAPTRHFVDGIKMYQEQMKTETDSAKKSEQLKMMIALYEQMAKCVGENATDRAWQGYNMYFYDADPKATLKILERALELGKNDASPIIFVPMAYNATYLFGKKDADIDATYLIKLYDTLKAVVDYQIKNKGKDAAKYQEKWAKVEEIYAPYDDAIRGCDFYVNQWKPAFEKDPNNHEQNRQILAALQTKCAREDAFYQQVLTVFTPTQEALDSIAFWSVKYPKLTPFHQADAQIEWAKRAEKLGRTAEASKRHSEADRLIELVVEKGDTSLTAEQQGTLAYRVAFKEYKKGNYSDARSFCHQASKYRPHWGEPYMLIGYMYAGSGTRCDPSGKGTGWDAQVVAWAAVDEWQKAKSIDPSKTDEANKLIAKYRKYFPTVGDIHQRSIKEGAAYHIGCWMNVTTTVRAASDGI